MWMESPRLLFFRLFFLSVHFQVLFLNQVSTSSNIVWKEFCSLTRGQRSTESFKVVWSYVGNSYDTKSGLRFLLRWPKERSFIPIVCLLSLGSSIDKCEIIFLVSPFCVCLTVVFVGYTWVSAGLKKAMPRQERLKNRWLAMKGTEHSITWAFKLFCHLISPQALKPFLHFRLLPSEPRPQAHPRLNVLIFVPFQCN